MPDLVTCLDQTPIYECYVVWCGSKNIFQIDMCRLEIELQAQKYGNHSRFNNQHDWGNLYDHLISTRISHFNNV